MPIDIILSYVQKTQSASTTLKLNANCARFISSITEKQFGTLDLMFIISISDHTFIVVFLRTFYLINLNFMELTTKLLNFLKASSVIENNL